MIRMSNTARNLPVSAVSAEAARWGDAGSEISSSLCAAATDYVRHNADPDSGHLPTPVEGISILRSFQHLETNHGIYRPSLCIVIQGAKQLLLADTALDYGAMQCLVVGMDLPASGRILNASPQRPFLSVTIELDVAAMREVLGQLDAPPDPTPDAGKGLFVADLQEQVADCVLRLFRMMATPGAIPILAPAILREIYYWLLTGPNGGAVADMALPDTHMDRISCAIKILRSSFAETLRMEQLASAARMSSSSFYQHFKALTSMTPLQYQKQLRLLEARRLMLTQGASVTEAAFRVGYESPSQFSRDYARAFGVAPKRDAMNSKRDVLIAS